jgi:hypothetical protein
VEQFKNKDVVFLSLCCKSTKQNWEKAIALENIPGEHYFVDDVNYDVISSFYSVDAFPTYILIDKNGEIKNLNAPRPSSNNVIIEEIQALLDYPNKQ